MADKALYVLAGFDSDTEKRLLSLQNALFDAGFTNGRQTRGLFPHVTLGCFPVEEEESLKRRLRTAAGQREDFALSFSHVGIFPGGEVPFVAPDVNAELLELRRSFEDAGVWTAHVTMLIENAPVIARAVPRLLDRFGGFSGRVNRICLYEFQPSRHILTLKLGSAEEIPYPG